MEVDDALMLLGKWGRWQVIYYVMLSIAVMFPSSWHMLAIVYIGYKPDHHCKVPANVPLNKSIPYETNKAGKSVLSSCQMYTNYSLSNNDTQDCSDGWNYLGDDGRTIVTEWDLVCSRGYLKDTSQTVLVIGVMIGAMFFTAVSDYIGRKPVFLFSQWAMVVIGVITAFIPNFYVFIFLRFITGMLQQGIILTGFVLACELFAARYRTFAGIIIEVFWATAWSIYPLLAFLIRDWHYLQLFISLFGLLTIPLFWLLPESVIWLTANDRAAEAEKIIRNAAKINKVEMPEHILSSSSSSSSPQQEADESGKNGGFLAKFKNLKFGKNPKKDTFVRYTLLDVLRHRLLRLYAIVMAVLWMVVTLVYYGLSLSTASFAGDRYLNAFLNAVIEIPAYTSAFFVLNRWGRRRPLVVYHTITGIALLICNLLEYFLSDAARVTFLPLIITFNTIGKFGITGSFAIVFLYAPEIFPTTVRGQALGIASLFGRLGNVCATYTSFVMELYPWLPGPLFGILSIAGGLLVLLLPETNNRPLPQTIEDIEQWSKKSPKKMTTKDEEEMQPLENDNKAV